METCFFYSRLSNCISDVNWFLAGYVLLFIMFHVADFCAEFYSCLFLHEKFLGLYTFVFFIANVEKFVVVGI